MPRTRGELPEEQLAEDGDTVAPVEGDGADVEDAGNGGVRAKANQVDDDAPEDRDPHGIEGSSGLEADLGPDVGEWQQAIT